MSYNQIGQPGFGIGAYYGVPVTVALGSSITATITGTAYATRQYVTGYTTTVPNATDITFIRIKAISTSGGVTGTYDVCWGGAGLHFYNDNQSFSITNTSSVSVNVVLIPA